MERAPPNIGRKIIFGRLAQLVEQRFYTAKVTGSNPVLPTKHMQQKDENPFEREDVAKQWIDSIEQEDGTWRNTVLYPSIQSSIDSLLPVKPVILDIGSGQGIVSVKLSNYKKYIGVEPSVFLHQRALDLYSGESRQFLVGDAYGLPVQDGCVDFALSINVWFHLNDLPSAAQELSRVLASGGTFYIVTANNDVLDIWKSYYVNPVITDKTISGEVKLPVNNLAMNIFYIHTNEEISNTLGSHNLYVDQILKFPNKEGVSRFIGIIGHKNK